jgi:anti-sigma regulatory factor (Ser/Thr protein kinase)
MKTFYREGSDTHIPGSLTTSAEMQTTASPIPGPALVAVYDALTAPPRVEQVTESGARDLIESLATRVYELSHAAGGTIPYAVVREVVENFIHAGFDEVVVSILDDGSTIRFADQGPGIPDKDRVFLPGFSTATEHMKRVIKGVGSGLPVARECLGFSGGTIEVEDNLGSGTVVTIRMNRRSSSPPTQTAEEAPGGADDIASVALTLRQKQVLSLAMELGALGPTVVRRELGVGLSTAYRDLEHLADLDLLASDPAGKRALTDRGIRYLDSLFGR